MNWSRTVGYMLLLLLLVGLLPVLGMAQEGSATVAASKIEAQLVEQFNAEGTADFIVRFVEQADLSPAYGMDWEARGEYVYNTLKEAAERSQVQAKAELDGLGLAYHTFIAGNELYVWAGELAAANDLAAMPEVDSIRATRVYQIPEPISSPDATVVWGIQDTAADQFWSAFGVQGDGIVVANIDTGVDYTHDALEPNYKCGAGPHDACWFDPGTANCSGPGGGPCDTIYYGIYHGTHTMGTMAADDDPGLAYTVGMAPDAQWIACLGCPFGSCPDFDLNSCADWMLQPGGNPDNRPHVVNNSWGGWGCDNWYRAKVQAWRAAGIFPAFSAGNSGSSCNSLGSPGDYQESFASAAHSENRNIAYFSSRGPSSCYGHDPYTKPNISAPGDAVISARPGDTWDTMSGTSMASPHSAGAVALLWSCNPSLVGQMDQTFEILQDNTDAAPAGNCSAPPDGEGNNTYGYGYLNVYTAGLQGCSSEPKVFVRGIKLSIIEPQTDLFGIQGLVRIMDDTMTPVGGATVDVSWQPPAGPPRPQSRSTLPNGIARFRLRTKPEGTYTLCVDNVTAAGYMYDPDSNRETCSSILFEYP